MNGVEAAANAVNDQTGIHVLDSVDPDDFIEVRRHTCTGVRWLTF